jgi:hypothetical protein
VASSGGPLSFRSSRPVAPDSQQRSDAIELVREEWWPFGQLLLDVLGQPLRFEVAAGFEQFRVVGGAFTVSDSACQGCDTAAI